MLHSWPLFCHRRLQKKSSPNDPSGYKSSQEMKCMNHIFQPAKLVDVLPDTIYSEFVSRHLATIFTWIFRRTLKVVDALVS